MFLSGTTNIQVGNGETFTLDYDALALLAGTFDPYFSEKGAYREVLVSYKTQVNEATRAQRKTLCFKGESNTDVLIFSTKAIPGIWVLDQVLIQDMDGGSLIITSADIPDLSSYELLITT